MNIRRDLYCSGATMTVRFINQRKTGHRVAVLDPSRRTRSAIVQMLLIGKKPREIARALDLPLGRVCALGVAGLRLRKKVGFGL